MKNYRVYIIRCKNGSLYTGISTDVDRRFKQHLSGKGAKFFRTSPPEKLLWSSHLITKSEALVTERVIKKMGVEGKRMFLEKMLVVLDK